MDLASQLSRMLRSQHFKGEANVRRSTSEPCVTALVLLAGTLILALSRLAGATTINASSASQSDVAAAIASAANGDIVIIPGGTITWTRTLRVSKGITIQGAGVGSTIIKDAVQSGQLFQFAPASGTGRVTGIEFQDGGRPNSTGSAPNGVMKFIGLNGRFRLDNCNLNQLNGQTVLEDGIGSVVDHCTLTTRGCNLGFYVNAKAYYGGDNGDGSWSAPSGFGGNNFQFIEDCTLNTFGPPDFVLDGAAGSRYVVRHCVMNNAMLIHHGTDSTGRYRGGRACEVYQNTGTFTSFSSTLCASRSGVSIIHDNHITGPTGTMALTLNCLRKLNFFVVWGGADGQNPADVNQPGGPFFTGTAAANSSNGTVTVSGVNWTANQWNKYTIKRTTNIGNKTGYNFASISGNTSNSITYRNDFHGDFMGITAGDTLQFWKVNEALDAPGRAGGSIISGDDPPIYPAGWNDQVTEPCYEWNNTYNGTNMNFSPQQPNTHFFNDTQMPGYTEYVYPHPLVTGNPPGRPSSSPAATRTSLRRPWGGKKQKETKRVRKPPRKAKENPINEMADGRENPGD
jgi:hypothetical protein